MLTAILSIASSLTSGILVFVVTSLLKENKEMKGQRKNEQTSIADGVQCLLRVKLIEYHNHYMEIGSIPSYALENWNMMYNAYHNLGGNGMITGMDNEVKKLKII